MTHTLGQRAMDLLDRASAFSEGGPGVTRQFCTPEHKAVVDLLTTEARSAGLEAELDAVANVVMRKPSAKTGAPLFLMGSHQDTVKQGGRYDGMLGVVAPLVALQSLAEEGVELDVDVEVVAFGDEEGGRFVTTLVGSSAIAGTFDPELLKATDPGSVTMRQALIDFGGDPERIGELARTDRELAGYVEVHIEQGPLLETQGKALGVVSAITGIERHEVVLRGQAGHAGTVPMELRQDALVVAAEAVRIVDDLCRHTDELVGVVGQLEVTPNSVNVIPGEVSLTVELRSPSRDVRERAAVSVFERLQAAADERKVGLEHRRSYDADGLVCSERLSAVLTEAAKTVQPDVPVLFSGAGHDGLAMQHLCEVAMLFVRCEGGVSHDPSEAITVEDADACVRVVRELLLKVGGRA